MAAHSKIEVICQSAATIQQSNNIGEITELARGIRIKRSQNRANVLFTYALYSNHLESRSLSRKAATDS